jgi:hypothetical protein
MNKIKVGENLFFYVSTPPPSSFLLTLEEARIFISFMIRSYLLSECWISALSTNVYWVMDTENEKKNRMT